MKQFLLYLTINFCWATVFGQAPNWQWAKSAGGNYFSEQGRNICTDSNGNLFVIGDFQSSTITFGNFTLTNAFSGSSDVFLVKYDTNGNILWAKRAGGNVDDVGNGITVDHNDNVIITGTFSSDSIIFDNYTIFASGAGSDFFIAKYDSSGNILWAKREGGAQFDRGYDISTDLNGNILLTGNFFSPSIIFGNDTLFNSGSNIDIFVVKYDSLGNALWARCAKNASSYSICADSQGNVIVSGWFNASTIVFGNDTLYNTGNSSEIFVVKYNSIGNVLWVKSAKGTKEDKCYGISTDADGNIFITGYFVSQNIIFGNDTLTNSQYTGYADDIFIAKYDSLGNVIWAKSEGGFGGDEGWSIINDANGNAWVTGYIHNYYILIEGYNSSGNVIWIDSIGTPNSGQMGFGITTDTNENLFLTGWFISPTITFGNSVLSNADNTGNSTDIFVAKLNYGMLTSIENHNSVKTNIFPNPFSNIAILQTDKFLNNVTITVDNVLGQTVKQIKNISGQSVTLLRDNLPSGLYFIRLTQDNKVIATEKLVITD